jgi:3-hydroxyacyl-[acyl-carrier-protein] dehydratase
MPPPPILDPSQIDLTRLIAGPEQIEQANPHRHEFRLLDGVVHLDQATAVYAGFHDIRPGAFWVRGHIPGRPLFPGVLMIEAAAQLASYLHYVIFPRTEFLGFIGVDAVKFRGVVQPPCRFVIVGRGKVMKPRRMVCDSQGFVDGKMVFEGEISGMTV